MDQFEEARLVYRLGRTLVERLAELAAVDDRIRWLREDLEDALLDLKSAVTARESHWVIQYLIEVSGLIQEIRQDLPEE